MVKRATTSTSADNLRAQQAEIKQTHNDSEQRSERRNFQSINPTQNYGTLDASRNSDFDRKKSLQPFSYPTLTSDYIYEDPSNGAAETMSIELEEIADRS